LRVLDSNQDRKSPTGTSRAATGFFARRISMMDVVMMALGLAFFALSIGYVFACDRL
jgi:hypothetical protein